jgi:hypothetical protein
MLIAIPDVVSREACSPSIGRRAATETWSAAAREAADYASLVRRRRDGLSKRTETLEHTAVLCRLRRSGPIPYGRCIALKQPALKRMLQKRAADRIDRHWDGQVGRRRLAFALITEHHLNFPGEPIQSAIFQRGTRADQVNVKTRGRKWQLIRSKAKHAGEPHSETTRCGRDQITRRHGCERTEKHRGGDDDVPGMAELRKVGIDRASEISRERHDDVLSLKIGVKVQAIAHQRVPHPGDHLIVLLKQL